MLKSLLVIGILTLIVLVSLSVVSAIELEKTRAKKESPLFGFRTNRAVERLKEKIENIVKTRFLKQRFALPLCFYNSPLDSNFARDRIFNKYSTSDRVPECYTHQSECTVCYPFC